jgi:hypothetical protein
MTDDTDATGRVIVPEHLHPDPKVRQLVADMVDSGHARSVADALAVVTQAMTPEPVGLLAVALQSLRLPWYVRRREWTDDAGQTVMALRLRRFARPRWLWEKITGFVDLTPTVIAGQGSLPEPGERVQVRWCGVWLDALVVARRGGRLLDLWVPGAAEPLLRAVGQGPHGWRHVP